MSKRVHVTGASGFLGGYVVPLLVKHGYEVSALSRSSLSDHRIEELGALPLRGDFDDPASVDAAFAAASPAKLVNLASLGFGHAPTIVASAEEAGLHRAIFVSTTAIFTKLNASSKAVRVAAEEAIRASELDWTIIRPTMIYGAPGDRNMWRLLRFLQRSPVLPLPGGGEHFQQPVHVADLATAVVTALGTDVSIRRAYDVGGPQALTFREIVEQAALATGRRPVMPRLPVRPIATSLKVVERTGLRLPVRAEQIERLVEDKAFDIGPAAADLDFNPRSFSEGIRAEANAL